MRRLDMLFFCLSQCADASARGCEWSASEWRLRAQTYLEELKERPGWKWDVFHYLEKKSRS